MSVYTVPANAPIADRIELLNTIADEGTTDPAIKRIAAPFLESTDTPLQKAQAILDAVHLTLPWRPDSDDTYQTVDETLLRSGDCDDLAPLYAALARAAGIKARVVFYPVPERDSDHIVVQVLIGDQWLYADPSVAGARIGEDPRAAVTRTRAQYILR